MTADPLLIGLRTKIEKEDAFKLVKLTRGPSLSVGFPLTRRRRTRTSAFSVSQEPWFSSRVLLVLYGIYPKIPALLREKHVQFSVRNKKASKGVVPDYADHHLSQDNIRYRDELLLSFPSFLSLARPLSPYRSLSLHPARGRLHRMRIRRRFWLLIRRFHNVSHPAL